MASKNNQNFITSCDELRAYVIEEHHYFLYSTLCPTIDIYVGHHIADSLSVLLLLWVDFLFHLSESLMAVS